MNKQRKIDTNVGKDTHVRSHESDMFRNESSSTFQMVIGEIFITEPEPLFRQNMVNVQLAAGGDLTSVAYPGAFIDPITGNIHGTYEGPIPGQMVMVGYVNGNSHDPIVINRYPYQGIGNTFYESAYINPLTNALFDATDVIIGHFSGSYLSFNTGILSGKNPGSVTLSAMTNCDISANTIINLSATTQCNISANTQCNISADTTLNLTGTSYISLNGTSDYATKYTEMKTAFDLLKTNITTNLGLIATAIASLGGSYVVSALTADMSSAKNSKVLM
jgi:hypothetical protein